MYRRFFGYRICTLFYYNGMLKKKTSFHLANSDFFKNNTDEFINKKKFLKRINKNNQCYITKRKGKIIGYHWLKLSQRIPLFFNLTYKLVEKGAIIWDCKTQQNFRQHSIYKNGVISILSMKKLKSFRKYIVIENQKKYLLKSIKKIGFKKTKTFICLKIFNFAFKFNF